MEPIKVHINTKKNKINRAGNSDEWHTQNCLPQNCPPKDISREGNSDIHLVSFLQVFRATALAREFALAVSLAHKAKSNSCKEAWNRRWQDVEYNPFDVNYHIFRVKIYKYYNWQMTFLQFKSNLIVFFVHAKSIQGTILTKFEIKRKSFTSV